MRRRLGIWRRFIDWLSHSPSKVAPVVNDIGTVFLGAAAIFLARAFPTSAVYDFDIWMTIASVMFCVIGLFLRYLSRRLSPDE